MILLEKNLLAHLSQLSHGILIDIKKKLKCLKKLL